MTKPIGPVSYEEAQRQMKQLMDHPLPRYQETSQKIEKIFQPLLQERLAKGPSEDFFKMAFDLSKKISGEDTQEAKLLARKVEMYAGVCRLHSSNLESSLGLIKQMFSPENIKDIIMLYGDHDQARDFIYAMLKETMRQLSSRYRSLNIAVQEKAFARLHYVLIIIIDNVEGYYRNGEKHQLLHFDFDELIEMAMPIKSDIIKASVLKCLNDPNRGDLFKDLYAALNPNILTSFTQQPKK